MPVFCAYCGKSFTRKEHLERHLPSHTNVKPHRCSGCHLSFTRRDLLQRHHATYHEVRDPLDPSPNGLPTITGRTPIACQNCANAKTGCDKRVPCSRCTDKNLPCAARFARRSSKAAVRAAQASAAINSALLAQAQVQVQTQAQMPPLVFMDTDGLNSAQHQHQHAPANGSPATVLPENQSPKTSKPQLSPKLPSPPIMDDFMHINPGTFASSAVPYHEFLQWPPDYSLDMLYDSSGGMILQRPDIAMPCFSDMDGLPLSGESMNDSSSSSASIHTRVNSAVFTSDFDSHFKPNIDRTLTTAITEPTGTDQSASDFGVVIAAESGWPLARCTPPTYSADCPRTAIVHLECLEHRLNTDDSVWAALERSLASPEGVSTLTDADVVRGMAKVAPLSQGTRDRMLAITQSFLHKALDIHRGSVVDYSKVGHASPANFNLVMLPPNEILQHFLRGHVRSMASYLPLVAKGCLDVNDMVFSNQASTLLVLLMIAQGAASVPMTQSRFLSAGLIETCRISLFDTIEKNVEFSADPVALQGALLFTILGAWSGDKWLMDIAMGQRGMYLSMLRHAGMLEASSSLPASSEGISIEHQWRVWQKAELRSRLAYNWVMIDQELALFHDTNTMLAVTDLRCSLPASESLWTATSAEQWALGMQSCSSPGGNSASAPWRSLYDLFQDFLQDNISTRQQSLTPMHLRLLLHPLQNTLSHVNQLLACFSDNLALSSWQRPRCIARESTLTRLEDTQSMLQRWYQLAVRVFTSQPADDASKATLVLYHLIYLNSVTNFAEVERLARKDDLGSNMWDMGLRHSRCITNHAEAIIHSGQALRLVRAMSPDRRPAWWSTAVYRATLTLWANAIASKSASSFQGQTQAISSPITAPGPGSVASGSPRSQLSPQSGMMSPPDAVPLASASSSPASAIFIDQILPDDALVGYLHTGEGTAFLSSNSGNGNIGLDQPSKILGYGVSLISDGLSTRIGDGLKRKLSALDRNWAYKPTELPQ
ncbi:hypothetical protein BROUX41_000204 [Berkeleyomyces rouxiae]|uniref:uncharacterized protein n=1 Tax=Berkeleyomyces rouxiae TaxID=2035830 RepID=UPI003B7F9E62